MCAASGGGGTRRCGGAAAARNPRRRTERLSSTVVHVWRTVVRWFVTDVPRNPNSRPSRPTAVLASAPRVGRPVLEPVAVATPKCTRRPELRAPWPGASSCGSVARAVKKATSDGGGRESLAKALVLALSYTPVVSPVGPRSRG